MSKNHHPYTNEVIMPRMFILTSMALEPPRKNESAKRLDRSLTPTLSQWEREIMASLPTFTVKDITILSSTGKPWFQRY